MSKRRIGIALVVVLGGLGCAKKKDDPKPAEAPVAAPAEAAAKPPGARPPGMRRAVAAITLDEVKDFLPPLDGARVIKANEKAQVGERIEAAYCFDKGELPVLADQIKARLTAAGWPEINIRSNPQVADRMGLSAHKPPYVMTGTIQRGMLPDCLSSKGMTYVAIGVHKIEMREGAMMPHAPGGPLPGAAGLGRPRPMGAPGPAGASGPRGMMRRPAEAGGAVPAPAPAPTSTP